MKSLLKLLLSIAFSTIFDVFSSVDCIDSPLHGSETLLGGGTGGSEGLVDLHGFQRDLQSLGMLADLAPWLQDRYTSSLC